MKKVFLVLVIIALSTLLKAQSTNPLVVVDTVLSGKYKVILFSDLTWKYVNHDSISALIKSQDSVELYHFALRNRIYIPDSATVFSEKWDTVNIFGYGGIDYKTAQDTLSIPLVGDTSGFVIPCPGWLQGGFGWRHGYRHNAVDIDLKTGDTVVSAFDGIVRYSGWNVGGYGNLVIIRHYNGLETYYAHLSKLQCKINESVKAGQLIGLGGSTGRSYAPHLHFETRYKDNPFDPQYIIDFETKKLKADTVVFFPLIFTHIPQASPATGNTSGTYSQASDYSLQNVSDADVHIVKSGDTLWAISNKYGVSIKHLCSLNGITEFTTLKLGQKLRIK
jgi:hypothetical protein